MRWGLAGKGLSWVAFGLLALCGGCSSSEEKNGGGGGGGAGGSGPDLETKFQGAEQTGSATYTAGNSICIHIDNGMLGGSLDIVAGSTDQLTASFLPFSWRLESEEQLAAQDMQQGLTMEVTSSAECDILVRLVRVEGSHPKIGADVAVTMPMGFDGDIEIHQSNGSTTADLTGGLAASCEVHSDNGGVDLIGAAGGLDFDIENGASTIHVQAWGDHTQDGHLHVGNGDLAFMVSPAVENGYISALADGPGATVAGPNGNGWVEQVAADNSKSYTIGDFDTAVHAEVSLTTGNGDIVITNEEPP